MTGWLYNNVNGIVSIPYGSIKGIGVSGALPVANGFQFHTVQLKVVQHHNYSAAYLFQFHTVQLKESSDMPPTSARLVSIPYGSIKGFVLQFRIKSYLMFQFHTVQLKESLCASCKRGYSVSIPYGSIKGV